MPAMAGIVSYAPRPKRPPRMPRSGRRAGQWYFLHYTPAQQDLKQELGLGHYEGRGWRGLHHHITLCIAAYRFLIVERAALPVNSLAITTP